MSIESFIVRNATLLHAVSPVEYTELQERFPTKKVIFIPNGEKILDKPNAFVGYKTSVQTMFGYCGRLVMKQKGLDLLLERFSLYKKSGGAGKLSLIGGGNDTQQLKAMAIQWGISEEVTFVGPLFGQDKLQKMQELDVFVHTSRWEGLPKSVLEAASNHLPLLVSKGTGMQTYMDTYQCGYLLEENTPEEISKALYFFDLIKSKPVFQEMISNAFKMVKDNFDLEKVASQMMKKLYSIPALAQENV
jgi:glycosyltransferase involved in cell wall biosynthesis